LNHIEPLIKDAITEKRKKEEPHSPSSTVKVKEIPVSEVTIPTHYSSVKDIMADNNKIVQTDYIDVDSIRGAPNPQVEKLRTMRADSSSYLTRDIMIRDPAGKEWWRQAFGNVVMVEWDRFIALFAARFPGKVSVVEIKQLQGILDHSNTGHMSQYKFSEYLKGFGPFEQCVDTTKKLLSEKWFHGFLSSRESELLLRESRQPDGSFLVRFSKSKPGSFALAFVQTGGVKHILVESAMPEGLKISEQISSGSTRVFKNIDEILNHYKFVLKFPYVDTVSQKPWFHGDLSAEEANELLSDSAVGTFLVRFSSRGCFAVSFVDSMRAIRHVLVTSEGKNQYQVNTGDGESISFPNIQDLVNYYHGKGIFKIPLKTTN